MASGKPKITPAPVHRAEDLRAIDEFFLYHEEPVKSCLLFLRGSLLQFDRHITEVWRYKMPFYCFRGKRFCYLWVQKKTGTPYLGVVEGRKINHPQLIAEKRSKMKILLIDPNKNIPVKTVRTILQASIRIAKSPNHQSSNE